METSFSDSELDKMDLESSLCNHSHFFAFSPHRRYSVPILGDSASPIPLMRANGSVERLECLEGVLEGNRYENKDSLAHDLSFLATMPELCDVTFLVGEDRQPVCGVRAILAARSRWVRREGINKVRLWLSGRVRLCWSEYFLVNLAAMNLVLCNYVWRELTVLQRSWYTAQLISGPPPAQALTANETSKFSIMSILSNSL